MSRILVVDDEHAICQAFEKLLRLEGHTPLIAASGPEALELARRQRPDAVFLDIQMPGMSGLEALQQLQAKYADLPVVVMTAYGTMETAIEAMRLGAFDYLGKPVELPQIRTLLQRMLHRPQPVTEDQQTEQTAAPGEQALLGQSAPMQEIFKLMGLLTGNDLTVMICGETGVGKELVARGIHRHSPRSEQPFVAINCAAIPEQLLESELFGHEKGAFSGAVERRRGRFEAVAAGSLFLDEITELPYHLQGKLLRVLQERSFERVGGDRPIPLQARVITATNRQLESEVEAGHFREDLYHRLNLVTLRIPPLRRRREDIPLLARHFLHQANQQLGKRLRGIEDDALQRLAGHHWPGNVRQLEHAIKRSCLLARGPMLTIHDLLLEQGDGAASAVEESGEDRLQTLKQAARSALQRLQEDAGSGLQGRPLFHQLVEIVETELIQEALRMSNGNQVAASALLGLHRSTLRKKLGTP